jgi:transcriptional regulator with XRE-family HTH domain
MAKSQKTPINMALKLAIVAAHPKTQRDIALASRVGEVRLSKIVNGVAQPPETPSERKAIAKALKKDVAEIFPSHHEAVAS